MTTKTPKFYCIRTSGNRNALCGKLLRATVKTIVHRPGSICEELVEKDVTTTPYITFDLAGSHLPKDREYCRQCLIQLGCPVYEGIGV